MFGPRISFDCKGFRASGYAVIALVALQYLYENSLRHFSLLWEKFVFIRQKDKYYWMVLCQHSITYFTNIFQNVRLLVLKTNLLIVKSSAMVSSVERRRFKSFTYYTEKRYSVRRQSSSYDRCNCPSDFFVL